jgi:hypothetical protein
LGCEKQELSIVPVDNEEITRLNRQHFYRHRPTNVIAFPMAAGDPAAINPQILGDVVISTETAERQEGGGGRPGTRNPFPDDSRNPLPCGLRSRRLTARTAKDGGQGTGTLFFPGGISQAIDDSPPRALELKITPKNTSLS